jgi:hypothetical protein
MEYMEKLKSRRKTEAWLFNSQFHPGTYTRYIVQQKAGKSTWVHVLNINDANMHKRAPVQGENFHMVLQSSL